MAMRLIVLLMVWTCGASARAADWPVYRGPTRDGVSTETQWTHEWPGGEPRQLFKVNVKSGFSTEVVRGDRLWTMGHGRGEDDIVTCLNADTGEEIWTHAYPALSIGTVNPDYVGTRATPTLDGQWVYTLSRDGQVLCLDAAKGTVRWEKNVAKEAGLAIPPWGFASSPIVFGDLLILNVGTAGMALDKNSGAIKWQTGKGMSGYATPTIYEVGGKARAAVFGAEAVIGLDPATGKTVWSVPWKTQYKINTADPIFHDGKLFVSSAYNFGCGVIDVSADKPKFVWHNKVLKSHFNLPVLRDGYLYGFDGNNITGTGLKCVEFATGKVMWTAEQPTWGNLILAGDRLIVLSQSCDLLIVRASPEKYQQLARAHPLGGTSWTAPVLAGGRLYLRNTRGDLLGLDLRKQ